MYTLKIVVVHVTTTGLAPILQQLTPVHSVNALQIFIYWIGNSYLMNIIIIYKSALNTFH